ncbi:MAG: hypothetical protein KAI79_11035 [Bacteroidales bacterium]|nr:hypothetical protein [Bacteroidales bacterium]
MRTIKEQPSDEEVDGFIPDNMVKRRELADRVISNINSETPLFSMKWLPKEEAILLVKKYGIVVKYHFEPDEIYVPLAKKLRKLDKKIDKSLEQLKLDIQESISPTDYLSFYDEFGIKKLEDEYEKTVTYFIPEDFKERIAFMQNLLNVFNKYFLNNLANGKKYWEDILNEYILIFNEKTDEEHIIITSIAKAKYIYDRVRTFLWSTIYLVLANYGDEWFDIFIEWGFEDNRS